MELPKISIVTPSFNQGQYIEQTILSIVNQNYPNLEYIIIDGGSSDNTIEVIKKYADRLAYWVSEPDLGQSDAINKGLAKCTGILFNWINSDDYLEPGALHAIGDAFINSGADIICGFTRIYDDRNNHDIMMHRTQVFDRVEATLVQQRINQPAMFYRLSVIKELGGINGGLFFIMDLELWFRYLCSKGQQNMVFIDCLIAHFRFHAASKTATYKQKFREEEKSLWHFMVSKLNADKEWSVYFDPKKQYIPLVTWNFTAIECKNLQIELSQKYLYLAFISGYRDISRKAYITLFKAGRLLLSLQNIALFVKLFIGNIPFRKYFKKHA